MAAPIGGSNADESKSSNVHIPSIFDKCTTRSPGSVSEVGSGDDQQIDGGPIPRLAEAHASSATLPRRAYRAKMGDVAFDVIKEREERRQMRRASDLQRIAAGIPDYNKPCFDRRQSKQRNVLTRMEECTTGPLSLLYRSVKENRKVKVWTRSFKSVRGICTGYVVAYDKHWNLAMYDVDEIYKNPAVKRKARSDRRKQKKKRLKQKTPQNVDIEEVVGKTDEVQDGIVVEKQKMVVEPSTDVKPEATVPKLADIKHMVLKDTACSKAAAVTTTGDGDKTTSVKEEDNTSEGHLLRGSEGDDNDEEDLESLALKLNKLKEELGEISVKEKHSTETLLEDVKTARRNLDLKQEDESKLSHLRDSSGIESKRSETVIDDRKCQSETKTRMPCETPVKEELKLEEQHIGYTSDGRRFVSCGKQTASSDLPTEDPDEASEDADGNAPEHKGILERHVNQLFIRGDNVVMVSLVPLQWI